MLAIGSSAWRLGRPNPLLLTLLVLALPVALVGPFDLAVHLSTKGEPLARVLLIGALVLTGAACASRSGLSLQGRSPNWIWIALGSALGIAAYVCVVDAWLFRPVVPLHYILSIQTESLRDRLSYYFLRAFQENVIYRMFVFSALTLAVSALRGEPASELPSTIVWGIAFATQILNVAINLIAVQQLSPMLLTYDFVRFVIPGALWGWLYWRQGFVTTEIGHVACHAFLQPALTLLI